MTNELTDQPAAAPVNGKHYKLRAAEDYAAAVQACLTEQEATARVASRYFVCAATLASWLSAADAPTLENKR
jgi:hypothetical protein